MNDTIGRAFKKDLQRDSEYADHIWRVITIRQTRRQRLLRAGYMCMNLASIAGFVFFLRASYGDFASSGFFEYAQLAFSQDVLRSSFREIGFALAESLPVVSVSLCLAMMFVVFTSLRALMRQKYYSLKTA